MVTITRYDLLVESIGDGTIDLDNDTFTVALEDGTHVFAVANNAFSQVTADQIATGNGYTQPGLNLTGVTWTIGATTGPSTATFNADDAVWTAAGGSITAEGAWLYDNSTDTGTGDPASDQLMFYIDFEGSESAGDTTEFKISWHSNGIFTLS